jgi:hypothetical protein
VAGRLLFWESESKEVHDARQDEHCPGSRVTMFLLQITEQEVRSMKRRLTILALTTLAAVALIGVLWTAPSPAFAGGATQISGSAVFDDPDHPLCPPLMGVDPPPDYALVMTGDLEGCLYTFVNPATESSPSGTYRETGTETFVGSYMGGELGTFETTYRFEAKYEDVGPPPTGEIFGRCQHPIVEGSGTGGFEGVSGRLDFKDDVETGEFFYRGHLRF